MVWTSPLRLLYTLTMNTYDNRARLVLHFAREEAQTLGHLAVEPEHLLLGLLREGGTASRLLIDIGVTLDEARRITGELAQTNPRKRARSLQITPEAAQVMRVAGLEAERLGSKSIHTEHMLLAVLGKDNGGSAQVLAKLTRPEMIRHILDAARSSQAA